VARERVDRLVVVVVGVERPVPQLEVGHASQGTRALRSREHAGRPAQHRGHREHGEHDGRLVDLDPVDLPHDDGDGDEREMIAATNTRW
jgi:hypothetical protein